MGVSSSACIVWLCLSLYYKHESLQPHYIREENLKKDLNSYIGSIFLGLGPDLAPSAVYAYSVIAGFTSISVSFSSWDLAFSLIKGQSLLTSIDGSLKPLFPCH